MQHWYVFAYDSSIFPLQYTNLKLNRYECGLLKLHVSETVDSNFSLPRGSLEFNFTKYKCISLTIHRRMFPSVVLQKYLKRKIIWNVFVNGSGQNFIHMVFSYRLCHHVIERSCCEITERI